MWKYLQFLVFGWSQNVNVTSGNLDGYTVTYKISKDEMLITYDETTSNSISGKTSDTTYYIWATAYKGDSGVCSDNYIKLRTGHKHSGSETSGGACYSLASTIECPKSGGYVISLGGTSRSYKTTGRSHCAVCASSIPGKTTITQYLSSEYNYIKCVDCGASIRTHGSHVFYVCGDHSITTVTSSFMNNVSVSGYRTSNFAIYTPSIGSNKPSVAIMQNNGSLSHYSKKTYALSCTLTESDSLCESISFN